LCALIGHYVAHAITIEGRVIRLLPLNISHAAAHATIDMDVLAPLPTHNQAVVAQQPRASFLSRKPSKRRKQSVSDKTAFFKADYIEIFTIGGGTKWLYAIIELVLEIFVLAKHLGIPMAGQIVDAYKACMDTPYLGATVKFLLGAATRVSFSVAGARAADHPSLHEVSGWVLGTFDTCMHQG